MVTRSKRVIVSSPTATACSLLEEVLLGVEACPFERCFHFQSLAFHHQRIVTLRHLNVAAPADRHPRKRFWNEEAIPRSQQPGFLGMGVKDADGVAGELGQLHRSGLYLIHRAAGAVCGEHCSVSTLNRVGERPQSAASEPRT